MARSIEARAQPALLTWARERMGFSIAEAAGKIGVNTGVLNSWELGDERPSIAQLRKIGEVYKRPIAIFFLPEPPKDFDPQREFRRVPGLDPQNETPELRVSLRLALFRREAARELYERLGERPVEVSEELKASEDAESAGRRIRQLLGIKWEQQLSWPSADVGLFSWRSAVESQGVLVFQTSKVKVEEMRGISIPHGPLPLILLNGSDAPHGRIFTLIHEFAHILLFNGGHRTSALEARERPEDRVLEQISNQFAAAALMPRDEFLQASSRYADFTDDVVLRRFANRIKVSPEAILRRLVTLGIVSNSFYKEKRSHWLGRNWYVRKSEGGGPPIEIRVVASAGRPFVSLVLEGYSRNAVSSADVVDYLGVQLKHIGKVARRVAMTPADTGF